jgi:hypothetical protein
MANSALTVEIVQIRTEADRLLFRMWRRNIKRMLTGIVLEMRGFSKGEIDDWIDFGRIGNPGAGDLGRTGVWR